MSTPAPIRLAHLSDTHLCREQYPAVAATGHNQRGVDVVAGWRNAIRQVVAADVPLVIHSGDVADRSRPAVSYILEALRGFAQLATSRPDGTLRQVIVVAGNHDEPAKHTEPCWLEIIQLPGVHVVTRPHQVITFDPTVDRCDPALADVEVHVVSHRGLRHPDLLDTDFAAVTPTPGKVSILTTHGVAEGSELFARAVGREYPIPVQLMDRGWDYVALGHYHKQGPVKLGSAVIKADVESNIWYAGSTETITLSDMGRDRTVRKRGWLDVTVTAGKMPAVTPRSFPVRAIIKLDDIDAKALSQEQLADRLADQLVATPHQGAIVVQKVTDVTREVWATTDTGKARAAAAGAIHYEIKVSYATAAGQEDADADAVAQIGFGDLPDVLAELLEELVEDESIRADVLAATHAHLAEVAGLDMPVDHSTGDHHDCPDGDHADSHDQPSVDTPADRTEAVQAATADPDPTPDPTPDNHVEAEEAAADAELELELEPAEPAAVEAAVVGEDTGESCMDCGSPIVTIADGTTRHGDGTGMTAPSLDADHSPTPESDIDLDDLHDTDDDTLPATPAAADPTDEAESDVDRALAKLLPGALDLPGPVGTRPGRPIRSDAADPISR